MQVIGMIGRRKKDKRNFLTFNEEIVKRIYEYSFIPMGILVDFDTCPQDEFIRINSLLDLCDGVILQGGSEYDDIDIIIIKYLHDNNIPTLGICLGMQTMAMAFGGIMSTIGNSHAKDFSYVHDVDIEVGSKLYDILASDCIPVNSRHHDYIVSTNLKVNARSDVMEGIEDANKDFFIGVQWHPESLHDINSQRLFNAFFESIKNKEKS